MMRMYAMRKTTGAFIIALVALLFALGLITGQGPTWAEEPEGQNINQPAEIDLAALAGESRWMELLAAASDAASHNVSDPVPVAFRLRAMRMLGETDAALKQADEAVTRFPDNARIILERAWIQAFNGRWPLALFDARRAQEIDPKLAEALIVQGIAYRELHDWNSAISLYTKALSLNPDDAVALLNRGRAFVEKGMWDEARSDLDRSIILSLNQAETFYHRGRANAGSGR
ncbi:MAG TPA: tetratricopeptide repeat protein, partial [Deltaproteobacteria bacterium]|nr:tetratricopeptide repeat protein [Deltaproteobacteria bacterium]